MFDAARKRMARTAVLAAAAERQVLRGRSQTTTLLVALTSDEAQQRTAWGLLNDLDLPPSEISVVVMGDRVAYAPDAFAGHVKTLGESEQDWRGLPKRSEVEALWARTPDVALHLSDRDDLGAAYLVGASPASVRIGPYDLDNEPFYDLMVFDDGDVASRVAALRHVLSQVTPPVLPLRTPS